MTVQRIVMDTSMTFVYGIRDYGTWNTDRYTNEVRGTILTLYGNGK
jgi:hypothetical protein